MTFRDLVRVLLRRWYVLVLLIAVAVGGFLLLDRSGGTYSTKPIIAFMLPGGQMVSSENGIEAEGVIGFAATVAEAVNNGRPIDRYAAEDAPAYGAGVREGFRIGVPNVGGQWGLSFTRAEIAISVVGRTEAWVAAKQAELVDRVLATAEQEQELRGTTASSHIETYVMPLSTNIEHAEASTRDRAFALGALLAAGVLAGSWAAILTERGANRFRRRHTVAPTDDGGPNRPSSDGYSVREPRRSPA